MTVKEIYKYCIKHPNCDDCEHTGECEIFRKLFQDYKIDIPCDLHDPLFDIELLDLAAKEE